MTLQALLDHAVALRERGELAQAEPILRRLLVIRPGHPFVCFLLGGVFSIFGEEVKWIGTGICLFVGFVMLTIATKGRWPPGRS